MTSTTMVAGFFLVLVGIASFAYALSDVGFDRGKTALIPAVLGVVLLILGFLAKSKENLRKHLMHAAVVLTLLGFIAVTGRLLSKLDSFALSAAVISQIAMALICLFHVILSIQSFASARRNQTTNE